MSAPLNLEDQLQQLRERVQSHCPHCQSILRKAFTWGDGGYTATYSCGLRLAADTAGELPSEQTQDAGCDVVRALRAELNEAHTIIDSLANINDQLIETLHSRSQELPVVPSEDEENT